MYIKKYATYLSLNVEELYQQFYGSQIQKEVEVKIHKQKVQKRNRNLGRVAGLVCAVLVIALGVFYVVDVVKMLRLKRTIILLLIDCPFVPVPPPRGVKVR